ncbi:hypothetical protein ANO11243_059060 [Dothideomycetidae sp. 11243]|nr:hypothetical protein ANO11243_059060 [fungal sp. No.11243]
MSRSQPVSTANATGVTRTVKPPCQIDAKAVVSEKAILAGVHPITIGANSALHPFARIDSTHGPVTIGEFCIIAERASVGLVRPQTAATHIHIHDYVSIETGAIVESSAVGKASTIGPFAALSSASQTGQFCKISAFSKLASNEALPNFTVVMDDGLHRIDQTTLTRSDIQQLKLKGQKMHLDTLRRLIPTNIAKWQ